MGLHALGVAAGGTGLAPAVCPADLEAGSAWECRRDAVARAHDRAPRDQPLQGLGDVDDVALVVAAQELVPDEMAAGPARMAVGSEDLRLADRPQRLAMVGHVVHAHVDPARVPALGAKRVDVPAAAATA